MKKTGSTIEKDIFNLIKNSALKSAINGSIYRNGMRPFNSQKEDAVVSFLTGLDGQFQVGIVNINIYIPDIDYGASQKVKDIGKCNSIEETCQTLIDGMRSSGYRFSLDSTIQTFEEEAIEQHFVNVRLKYQYVSF